MLTYDTNHALEYLRARDEPLGRLIAAVGGFELENRHYDTPFHALFAAIISQQLSGKAAGAIYRRTRSLFPRRRITAPAVAATSEERLRDAGLSRAKVAAVRDLAARYLAGALPNAGRMKTLSDEQIIEALVEVRGVGRWTAEMLLIFHLGRPDVLPAADLGVRKGYQIAFKHPELPTEKALLAHGERWRPYRSVASWYLWRATELDTALE